MSRQLISSEKFPPKPHNCKFEKMIIWLLKKLWERSSRRYSSIRPRGQSSGSRLLCRSNSYWGNQASHCTFHSLTIRKLLKTRSLTKALSLQRTVLQNLKEVLELSGSSLEKVVKYNVYLADMKDFAAMNEVYIDFLPQPMPSRSCLQAVPPGDGTVIEIECIAQAWDWGSIWILWYIDYTWIIKNHFLFVAYYLKQIWRSFSIFILVRKNYLVLSYVGECSTLQYDLPGTM